MRFTGTVYRAHNPQWAFAPLSGDGASRHGGRFNRRGVPALYTAATPVTALLEASPLGRPFQPITLVAYAVDAEPIFDARDPTVRAAEGVTANDLRCPNWEREMLDGRVPASQALADRLMAAGYVGMRVPSFARGAGASDTNLVFWRWADGPPAQVVVIDDQQRLPKDRASWTG